ncbi:MAG: type I methionyl aminopeptidase [bacterium]|nr:type I methionyl aminopeptidase [bacterium]
MKTRPKTPAEIDAMREGGKMLAKVHASLKEFVEVGMSTKDLDDHAEKVLKELGGKPAFKGYGGFPGVLCVSLNEEVVHGIPSKDRIIREGDIVSMDFGVTYKGMITDAAFSMIAGVGSKQDEKLLKATRRSLDAGVNAVIDGVKTGTIGAAVQEVLDGAGFGIVRDYVGHGVGHQLHEEPNIPNFGLVGQGPMLHSGMTIAIEPMATIGGEDVELLNDGWTVKTADGLRSAHFEQTILITNDGAEVLTELPD